MMKPAMSDEPRPADDAGRPLPLGQGSRFVHDPKPRGTDFNNGGRVRNDMLGQVDDPTFPTGPVIR